MTYHKDVYFSSENNEKLEAVNDFLSRKKFNWSIHAKKRLERVENIKFFYNWYQDIVFKVDNIIEYTVENDIVMKVLYRIRYNNQDDICLSISNTGNIITLWTNNSQDKHQTLNIKQYATI